MKPPKQPLKVGDRVRVYGWASREPFVAVVLDVRDSDIVVRESGMSVRMSASPKQCRRLKPKAKQERVEHWAEVNSKGAGVAYYHGKEARGFAFRDWKGE